MTPEQQRPPRDEEEAAAFKGMGQAVTIIRERRGMDREELAARCEMTPAELEEIERGELDERWGDLRLLAKALDTPLPALLMEAEEFAPGRGGEQWRQSSGEAEAGSAAPGARSDAAEGRSGCGGRRGR
jgi:transcriptional regulator with XRE-family HTH domain